MKILVRHLLSQRRDDGLSTLRLSLPDQAIESRLDIGFSDLALQCPSFSPVSLDFLLIASACYASDKLAERRSAEDCWTREFEITVPVSDPDAWEAHSEILAEALRFLSGDVWTFTFSQLSAPLYQRPVRRRRSLVAESFGRPEAVCLFSGGLDSLAGVIDLLEGQEGRRIQLIGHYDAPTGEQVDLFDPLRRHYPNRVRLARARIRLDPVAGEESTLRTRSLVFLALGMCAARAYGSEVPLYAYENGHIALNIPLTPSRSGSCSTRTMHPYFLDRMVALLSGAGIANPLLRPYEMKTKGECVAECRNFTFLRSVVPHSVSCSHASRRQNWVRRDARNCGYCVPCLIRRGALYKAGMDVGYHYGIDVCAGELPPDSDGESADDLRAMLDFLRQDKDAGALAVNIQRISSVSQLAERAEMLARGFHEVRTLFRDKGVGKIQQSINP